MIVDRRLLVEYLGIKHLGYEYHWIECDKVPGPFFARNASQNNLRIMSDNTGGHIQFDVFVITISGFSTSDSGGSIRYNIKSGKVTGTATILVGE